MNYTRRGSFSQSTTRCPVRRAPSFANELMFTSQLLTMAERKADANADTNANRYSDYDAGVQHKLTFGSAKACLNVSSKIYHIENSKNKMMKNLKIGISKVITIPVLKLNNLVFNAVTYLKISIEWQTLKTLIRLFAQSYLSLFLEFLQ